MFFDSKANLFQHVYILTFPRKFQHPLLSHYGMLPSRASRSLLSGVLGSVPGVFAKILNPKSQESVFLLTYASLSSLIFQSSCFSTLKIPFPWYSLPIPTGTYQPGSAALLVKISFLPKQSQCFPSWAIIKDPNFQPRSHVGNCRQILKRAGITYKASVSDAESKD